MHCTMRCMSRQKQHWAPDNQAGSQSQWLPQVAPGLILLHASMTCYSVPDRAAAAASRYPISNLINVHRWDQASRCCPTSYHEPYRETAAFRSFCYRPHTCKCSITKGILVSSGAGVAATLVNDAVMVPADVIKQRLQVSQGQYRGVLDCIMQTWRHEGLGAFYRQACSVPCALASFPFILFHGHSTIVKHFKHLYYILREVKALSRRYSYILRQASAVSRQGMW